ARNQLTEGNLRLAISVAKKYATEDYNLEDCITAANFGLIRAAEKFDPTKGYRFSTYAVWWIRQSIIRAIQDHSRPVRAANTQQEALVALMKERDRQIQIQGRADIS